MNIIHSLRWLSCAIALSVLSACKSLPPSEHTPHTILPTTPAIDSYLEIMNSLIKPDAGTQRDMYYEVERAYTQAPTTMNSLRHALALATPGQPAFDVEQAKKMLEKLLATPDRMSAQERTLATVILNNTNSLLKLHTEQRRLTATIDDCTRTGANSERRLQTQLEENAKLRRELDAAQQKLDAVKHIERSISERSTTPRGNRELNRDTATQTQSTPTDR